MSSKIAGVAMKLVESLQELETPDERGRAVRAALAAFGDQAETKGPSTGGASLDKVPSGSQAVGDVEGIHASGVTWMTRNGLTREHIDEVFHIEEKGLSLLKVIGKSKREQTVNTYILTGIANLLHSGKAEFTDADARKNCTELGCYDQPNHSRYLGELGNAVTGSKDGVWKVTVPGQATAAKLLKPAGAKGTE